MCGIIGRVSLNRNPIKSLNGLKELEYRGYDSYGMLFYDFKNKTQVLQKDVGELDLSKLEILKNITSNIEIGHTRWATHGKVSKRNAHPQNDENKEFFIVMNGIVENYMELKEELESVNFVFNSETDTEVIVQMFSFYFLEKENIEKDLLDTTKKVLKKLKGEFSFLLKYKNYLLAYKNINPIIIGFSDNEVFVSSDMSLVQNNSEKYCTLEDGELFLAYIKESVKYDFYDINFKNIQKSTSISIKKSQSEEKVTGYYMEKEIFEQKDIRKLLTPENLQNLNYLIKEIKDKKIFISAAGSSYNASFYLHYKLLEMGILSQVILASELKNYIKIIKNSMLIVFSQSGETADLIYPLKELKSSCEIFTITNTLNSTLEKIAQKSVYLNCGKEVAVASTKTFVFQIFTAEVIGNLIENKIPDLKLYEKGFFNFLKKNDDVLNEICMKFKDVKDFFFIGRNKYYPLALEGALKLKEISYIHAEGFAGGELKHGSLALVEKDVPCVVLGDDNEILSNAIEISTRRASIIGINNEYNRIYDYFIEVPKEFKEIYSVIVLQLLSIKITLLLNHNPDKPRNLAKSVTVK